LERKERALWMPFGWGGGGNPRDLKGIKFDVFS